MVATSQLEASDRALWVNVASGLLVLAGIFGVLNWLLILGTFSELAYVPSSGVEVEMPAEGDWRVRDDAGDVVFEGSPDEFERWHERRRSGFLPLAIPLPGGGVHGSGNRHLVLGSPAGGPVGGFMKSACMWTGGVPRTGQSPATVRGSVPEPWPAKRPVRVGSLDVAGFSRCLAAAVSNCEVAS